MNVDASSMATLDFAKGDGLIPAIVQHARSGDVLMLGYMNQEAMRATLERRRVVFYSRTRAKLWEKGETSGHALDLVSMHADCDRDTVLIEALPRGPVCHTGTANCFATDERRAREFPFLATLEDVVAERALKPAADSGSYTSRLFHAGIRRIAQKVGEEGVETALAAAGGPDSEVLSESADLLFHLFVLLRSRGLKFSQVVAELEQRHPVASDARRSASAAS